jgi:peptidoglycan/LPS O-acetylase OafA/YrhL
MIPFFPGLAANGSSLDGPTWTLLPELIANFVYAGFIKFMNLGVLTAIVLVCGAGLILAELRYGTLDVGFGGTDQWAALTRVGFSFFMGVLLFRFFGEHRQNSEWASWTCMAVLAVFLAFRPTEDQTPWFELGVILFGFPALLVVAGRFEPGALTGRTFSYIGLVSYGVYIVHQPMGNLVRIALRHRFQVPLDARGLVFGAVFLVALTVMAGWLDKAYDGPVRKVLRKRFLDRPRAAVGAKAR